MRVTVTSPIAFPALATLQHDQPRLIRAYFKLTRVGGALILPAYVGLALIAPELIVVLFGQRWTASGPVAALLFLIGPVLTLQAFSVSLFYAAGHPQIFFRFRLIAMIVRVAGFLVAVPFGILAVAGAFAVSGYLMLPLNLYWQRVYAGVRVGEYLAQLRGVALATAAMALAIVGVKLAPRYYSQASVLPPPEEPGFGPGLSQLIKQYQIPVPGGVKTPFLPTLYASILSSRK